MLTGISWGQFLFFWMVLLMVYYMAVASIFYRKDILHLLKNGFARKKVLAVAPHADSKAIIGKTPVKEVIKDKPTDQSAIHDLLEELKTVLSNAAKKSFQKEELLMALQVLFKKYQSIKNTPFQIAVNNQIIRECQDSCAIELRTIDLINIW